MIRLALGLASPNVLAGLCAALLPPAIVCWARIERNGAMRVLAAVVPLALACCLLWSASRGGLIAAEVGLAVFAALAPRGARLAPILAMITLGLGATLGALGDRWGATSPVQPSVATRLYLWRVGSVLAADHPWTGIGGEGDAFGLACEASSQLPAHLPYRHDSPFSGAINDPLDVAAKHGLPLAMFVVAFAVFPLALGLAANRQGQGALGISLAAAGSAWLCAGQWSCVWFADPVSAGLIWPAFLVAAIAVWKLVGWVAVARSALVAAVAAVGWCLLLLGIAQVVSDHQPRLIASAGPARWSFLPRDGQAAPVAYLAEADQTEQDLLYFVLRPIAESGFSATAVSSRAGAGPVGAGPEGAGILVAHGSMAGSALDAGATGTYATIVLLDPPAECAARPCGTARLIAVHGEKALARDREAWHARPDALTAIAPCARLWDNRLPAMWPFIAGLIRQRAVPVAP